MDISKLGLSGASAVRGVRAILPGLVFVVLAAFLARLLHRLLPEGIQPIFGEVIFGIALGLFLGNVFSLPATLKSGVSFSFNILLKTAIVLLGLRITFQEALSIGGGVLLLIVFIICLALFTAVFLGQTFGISRKLAVLIGVGTAVCGNTAIAAVSPVIKASDEETAFAIATNTLFGTLAVFLYPLLGHFLGLSDVFFGSWAGLAVNDTSQVVAAGFAYSEEAGTVATTVKLTRNALMGFVIVGVGMMFSSSSSAVEESKGKASFWRRIKLPPFVLLFLVVAGLNSAGLFSRPEYDTLTADIRWLVKFLILTALSGVGLNTKFASMKRIGWKPFALGFLCATITSVAGFSLLHIFRE